MKNTVSTNWYCLLLRWKTPFQNFWTLLTTPTMRQSSRWFASWPVRQSWEVVLGVSPCPTLWPSSGPSWPEPAAAAEQRVQQQVDDETDDPEAAAADAPGRPAPTAPADVRDLARVERCSPAKAHGPSLPSRAPRKRERQRGAEAPLPIGVPRFELGTSPTRTERATRLRHTPSCQSVAEARGLSPASGLRRIAAWRAETRSSPSPTTCSTWPPGPTTGRWGSRSPAQTR